MIVKTLADTMARAGSWPTEAQEEWAAYAEEIEAGLRRGLYRASPDELAGIDRGLAAAKAGHFAPDGAVEAVFARRPA